MRRLAPRFSGVMISLNSVICEELTRAVITQKYSRAWKKASGLGVPTSIPFAQFIRWGALSVLRAVEIQLEASNISRSLAGTSNDSKAAESKMASLRDRFDVALEYVQDIFGEEAASLPVQRRLSSPRFFVPYECGSIRGTSEAGSS